MANSSVSAVKSESSANAVEAAEDGELVDEEGKPSTLTRHGHKRETMGALVDVNKLKSFVTKKVASAQVKAEDEDESDSDEGIFKENLTIFMFGRAIIYLSFLIRPVIVSF